MNVKNRKKIMYRYCVIKKNMYLRNVIERVTQDTGPANRFRLDG